MCGFGVELRPGERPDRRALERMGAAMAPRGPDGAGLWLDGSAGLVHRLEARTPFLDHELVELAAACPPELKLAEGGKGVLKAAARGVVQDAVIDRPKGYFPVPALSHLEGPVLELVRDALGSDAARSRGLFRRAVVDEMLADPNAHRTNLDGSTLWQLALLELWLQRHVGP